MERRQQEQSGRHRFIKHFTSSTSFPPSFTFHATLYTQQYRQYQQALYSFSRIKSNTQSKPLASDLSTPVLHF